MKNNEDPRWARALERKRQIEAERRDKAISRRKQETLKRLTPGVATPATVASHMRFRHLP